MIIDDEDINIFHELVGKTIETVGYEDNVFQLNMDDGKVWLLTFLKKGKPVKNVELQIEVYNYGIH